MHHHLSAAGLAAALTFALVPARATTIVNIAAYTNAETTGSSVSNTVATAGEQETFFDPVMLTLAAGDYTISDAYGLPGALYDAWNFEASVAGSWTGHFGVGAFVSGDATAGVYTLLIDGEIAPGPGHFGGYDTEAEAASVFAGTAPFLLHLTTTTTVGFTSTDDYLNDNLGGISLAISTPDSGPVTAVPEPSVTRLLALGFGCLVGVARVRRPASAVVQSA